MFPFVLQVVYKEKDSDSDPDFWPVEGNTSHSVQLNGLGKYVLYEIQVLAFTRVGDGRSSSPFILERTLDDGTHAYSTVQMQFPNTEYEQLMFLYIGVSWGSE